MKKELKIIRKTERIEFKYDGDYYIFERRSEGPKSFDFIWDSSGEKIYGPFHGDSSEEGENIHKRLIKKVDKKN